MKIISALIEYPTMLIFGALLGGAVVIFMLQNLTPVSVTFLVWNFEGSLALIVILALVLGMLISWIFSIPDMFQVSNLKSRNKKLENDLEVHKQKLSQTEVELSRTSTPDQTVIK